MPALPQNGAGVGVRKWASLTLSRAQGTDLGRPSGASPRPPRRDAPPPSALASGDGETSAPPLWLFSWCVVGLFVARPDSCAWRGSCPRLRGPLGGTRPSHVRCIHIMSSDLE